MSSSGRIRGLVSPGLLDKARRLFRKFAASRFQTYPIADISTAYLEESDSLLLLDPQCPTRFAITDDMGGTFHVVTQSPDLFKEEMAEASAFGLSDRFRQIMESLHTAGILYVRFDADGGEIEGLERIITDR